MIQWGVASYEPPVEWQEAVLGDWQVFGKNTQTLVRQILVEVSWAGLECWISCYMKWAAWIKRPTRQVAQVILSDMISGYTVKSSVD